MGSPSLTAKWDGSSHCSSGTFCGNSYNVGDTQTGTCALPLTISGTLPSTVSTGHGACIVPGAGSYVTTEV